MNINSIDLNLFLVFQAIYATRSVTLAGDRLGMTQSAVSNALKRMRERFNDALFVRSADGMVPTPVAERLIAPIEEGIACLVQAVDQGRTFEPETSSRIFRIAVNDIGQLVMVPELISVARGIAPGFASKPWMSPWPRPASACSMGRSTSLWAAGKRWGHRSTSSGCSTRPSSC